MVLLRRVLFNRWTLLAFAVVIGSAQLRAPRTPAGALQGLTSAQIQVFNDGKAAFAETETAVDGLGPIFNGASCGECHPNGSGTAITSKIIGTGNANQWNAGGPVIQIKAIQGFSPEAVPTNIPVAIRRSMRVQGLGLIGAIPDADILREQTDQQNLGPLIAGKANIVTDAVVGNIRVGRIGQKSQHPNSTSFAAEAYLREMGITTPYFPNEEAAYNNPALLAGNPVPGMNDDGEDVLKFGAYMDLLAPPPNNPPKTSSQRTTFNRGYVLFGMMGCADCHKENYTTGPHAVAALSGKVITPWSDFLLHDMGAAGDQVAQGTDTNGQPIPGSWMRTTPLWGCRLNPVLWHDGSIRQGDYTAAINKHDGQGLNAKLSFQALSSTDKQALLAFLNGL